MGVNANGVIGRIANLSIGFAGVFQIGTNAAEPDQADICFQYGFHQSGRFDGRRINAQHAADFRR